MEKIIEIKQLKVDFVRKNEPSTPIIRNIDLSIPKNKIVGIVGESGSGKSMSVKSLMGLTPKTMQVSYENFLYHHQEIQPKDRLSMSMIFQDPMTSLNPVRKIGFHLEEILKRNNQKNRATNKTEMLDHLQMVGIDQPEKRLNQYPHELSGGMRQRIMIAMALLAKPELLIADEPTTALDVTIQAQILKLIKNLQVKEQLSVILVSHDFGVIAGMCDFVKVMYQGKIVEEGTTDEIFYNPQHPYTKELLKASKLTGEKLHTIQDVETIEDELLLVELSPTHRVWKNKNERERTWKS